jgi:hypothetical protein
MHQILVQRSSLNTSEHDGKIGPDTSEVWNLNISLSSTDNISRQKSKYPSTKQWHGWTGIRDIYRAFLL